MPDPGSSVGPSHSSPPSAAPPPAARAAAAPGPISAGLAPYAMPDTASRGRDHASSPDPHRTCFQRDRDRIVHSRAFRRLQYKTQVFTSDEGDHFRSRLTHTIEVAQLSRAAARRLRLNEDLVECIALVHDIGHPPFGHRGEDLLATLMAEHGGFEHNRQGLRLVEELERRYPEFPGLNLTYEVRESIVKHAARYDRSRIPARFQPQEHPLLEAALVDEVDSIVYDCHDIDDGLRGGYLSLEALQELPVWRGAWQEAQAASPRLTPDKLLIDRALRIIMDSLLGSLIDHTAAQVAGAGIASLADVRASSVPLVGLPASVRSAKEEVEAWLFAHLYRHHHLNLVFHTARRMLGDLFRFFTDHPDSLPPEHAERAAGAGLHRAVSDYIAGMTDRFAMDLHRRIFAA